MSDPHDRFAGYDPSRIGVRESSDGVHTVTVYVSIGNSDDKLPQAVWARFVADVKEVVAEHADQVYGQWYSVPDGPYQNMVTAFLLDVREIDGVKTALIDLRDKYLQDSIAWVQTPEAVFL
jgi:hypothetical protein